MSTGAEKTTAEILSTPVQFLKGVGPQRAELLARLELRTAGDLLLWFPRDYQDLTNLRAVPDLEEGELASVRGTVEEVDLRETGIGRSVLGVLLRQGRHHLRGVWFNMPYLREKFTVGSEWLLAGKPKYRGLVWEMVHPQMQPIDTEADTATAVRILPLYSLAEGLTQGLLRRVVEAALRHCLDALEEAFPEDYLRAHDLAPIREALANIHFPTDHAALDRARRRLIYQELFLLQLGLAVRRRRLHDSQAAPPLPATARIDARIRRLFPFELTSGQTRAIGDVATDMARATPMNRLLQGDVGCGKTVVALYAILLAVAHGQQAALMAPTEVLARQHLETLGRFLADSRVCCGALLGGQTAAERRDVLAKIKSGEIDVVIGTQAIVQADMEFTKLGLVVIDEQHKFGVRQRARLKQAGLAPHYLVMTATPIPRTLAMTQFGDLDVSILRDAPPGRQPVHTYWAEPAKEAAWWDFFRRKLREGRQGYVVAPLVEESENLPAASLAATYEALVHGELADFRLGMVHGRMPPEEKRSAMEDFRAGRTQALIATSVVEVGIDVPNATLMTILDAERFGLAQLHQLRGRVCRGAFAGYCCAFGQPRTEESRGRLEAFVGSTDGFELAEVDFRLRGPGDLLGSRQHGLPPLYLADLQRDTALLEEARRDAWDLTATDAGLAHPQHARLRRLVLSRYGPALDLGDVG